MTRKEASKLRPGDEVFWSDPDAGQCSRSVVIQTIELTEDVAVISEPNGTVLVCFVNELS